MGTAHGQLKYLDGRVKLVVGEKPRSVSALSVFEAAIRGSEIVEGVRLQKTPQESCQELLFRPEPLPVGILIESVEGSIACRAVVVKRRELHTVQLEDDHVVLGSSWYPIQADNFDLVRSRIRSIKDPTNTSYGEYASITGQLGDSFPLFDRVETDDFTDALSIVPVPSTLSIDLYQYQQLGFSWLKALCDGQVGAILADEMGLGKTAQVIALLLDRSSDSPSLVIVPLTLVTNWVNEILKFGPTLKIYPHHGPNRARTPQAIIEANPDIVLTTYETATNDAGILRMIEWDLVVADEAQAMKNPSSQRAIAIKSFSRVAAVAMTGTPLENRIEDLLSICEFAVPRFLPPAERESEPTAERVGKIRDGVRPILLRRRVLDVLTDLPEKSEIDTAVNMFASEAQVYEEVRRELQNKPGGNPLASITYLRQISAHPHALDLRLDLTPVEASAKFATLMNLVDEWVQTGTKFLVFSAFRYINDLITAEINRRFAIGATQIDGRTPPKDRQELINSFSSTSGSSGMVLNPIAGGVGLNIQAASRVVHYTLEWNPAKEIQATARAWRMGQKNQVMVHRLYYPKTVDEFLLTRLEQKRDLFDAAIPETDEDRISSSEMIEALKFSPFN